MAPMSAEDLPTSSTAPAGSIAKDPAPALRWAALAAAGLQLVAALTLFVLSAARMCPVEGSGSFSCAALVRPRLGQLGPVHVSELALFGSALTLGALIFLLRRPKPLALIPGAGAGLALSAQTLSVGATDALCPLCFGLALLTGLTALLTGLWLRRAEPAGARWLVFALLIALSLAAPLGFVRGTWLQQDDLRRAKLLSEAGGGAGPKLYLVSREGCPHCETLRLDVLADEAVFPLLKRVSTFETVAEDDALAQEHAGGPGAPVLFALDGEGKAVAKPLRGAHRAERVRRWLEGVAPVGSEKN
ncbi:MAG TPA: hypothetical protein DEA08_38350 [Planctomycetes bacterium]|nr:hypothetical protein [Planctomycetota bacterium]